MSNDILTVQVVNENGTWVDTLNDRWIARYGTEFEIAPDSHQHIHGYVTVITPAGVPALLWLEDVEGVR